MKIHEYQAKETLKKFNVPVQDGIAIKSLNEFDGAINQLQQRGINQFVVKSQIHITHRSAAHEVAVSKVKLRIHLQS